MTIPRHIRARRQRDAWVGLALMVASAALVIGCGWVLAQVVVL